MEIPVKAAKVKRKKEERTILIIKDGASVLMRKRGSKGLLAGMIEPVNLDGRLSEQEAAGSIAGFGLACRDICRLGDSKHLFTHIEWHMTAYQVLVDKAAAPEGYFWAEKNAVMSTHAVPSAFKAYYGYMIDVSPGNS